MKKSMVVALIACCAVTVAHANNVAPTEFTIAVQKNGAPFKLVTAQLPAVGSSVKFDDAQTSQQHVNEVRMVILPNGMQTVTNNLTPKKDNLNYVVGQKTTDVFEAEIHVNWTNERGELRGVDVMRQAVQLTPNEPTVFTARLPDDEVVIEMRAR